MQPVPDIPAVLDTLSNNKPQGSRLRWGLCCQFAEEPIRFRSTTATSLLRLSPQVRQDKLSQLCLANAQALASALRYCASHRIGCFRVLSSLLPVQTHPAVGYQIADLPDAAQLVNTLQECGRYARSNLIRTVFHPDQYVVLNSPRSHVVENALQDLESHAELAELLGADVINIHAGGAYGNKQTALAVLEQNLDRLSAAARSRLTVENDDKVYTPRDLLPFCRSTGLPLVYDVHHHRCLADGWSVEQATQAAWETWEREPVFHLSSPREGWAGPQPHRHHDYIDPNDFPAAWSALTATIEIEAKAKELALFQLRAALGDGRKLEWKPPSEPRECSDE